MHHAQKVHLSNVSYIFTRLMPYTRNVFNELDDNILDYQNEEGQWIEPKHYVPIIPMVLVNGADGSLFVLRKFFCENLASDSSVESVEIRVQPRRERYPTPDKSVTTRDSSVQKSLRRYRVWLVDVGAQFQPSGDHRQLASVSPRGNVERHGTLVPRVHRQRATSGQGRLHLRAKP